MRILWVEDEWRVIDTKNTLFGNFSDNIIIEKEFIQTRDKLASNLHCYDLLILDIDLRHSSQNTDFNNYLDTHKEWEIDAEKLLSEAGFHLFLTAFQQAFPVERIAFFTGNVDPDARSIAFKALLAVLRSDDDNIETALDNFKKMIPQHEASFDTTLDQALEEDNHELLEEWYQNTFNYPPADETANTFKECFKQARIPTPEVFDKKKPEEKQKLIDWLTQQHTPTQNTEFEYLTLRRGLLDTLEQLTADQYQLKPNYDELLDKATFIEGLEWLLKPHHRCPNKPEETLYLTLCDQLSKPFDNYNKNKKPPKYLNFLRNKIAHGNIKQCANLTQIKAETIALFFLLALEELLETTPAMNTDLQKLFTLLPQNTEKVLKTAAQTQNFDEKIKNNSDQINLIEYFYDCCLKQLPQTHPLTPHLKAAYAKEPSGQ
jgi:hypothetical protein